MAQEWSVHRTENKYFMKESQAASLREKLDILMKRDDYSSDRGYMVRSLYFDSLNDHDFVTKMAGTEVRRKIRLRIYNHNDPWCKLEIKKKIGAAQHKSSIRLAKEDAIQLIKRDFTVLRKYFDDFQTAVEIYSVLVQGCYRPVALVEYERTAYTHPINNTRITFDKNIRSSESYFDLFAEKPNYSVYQNSGVILEVKYNGKLLNYISRVLRPYHLNQLAISKYCMGRKNHLKYLM